MLGGGAGADVQLGVPDARSITVVESSHRIDFPNGIRVTLEADAPADVQSVRLFYTIGSQPTQIYTYPSVIRVSETLDAQFTIRTTGDSFIPQGVDIEYFYVFIDSEGTEIESNHYTFEYLDPRYRWQRLELDDYILLWHDRSAARVRAVAEDVSSRLVQVKRLFGVTDHHRLKAVLVNGRREANRSFPAVSQTSRDTYLYGGFAFGDYGTLVLSGLNADGLTHELTHLMLDRAVNSPRARIPAWLNEGLAMYFERNGQPREREVRHGLSRGGLLRLRHMGAVPGRPEDVHMFYAQSASVVRFLLDRFGEAGMQRLLSEINQGRGIDDALRQSYGARVDDIDAAWRDAISGRRSISPSVDPGTLGTSVIIAGAILATATALGVAWLRQNLGRKAAP